MTGSELDVTEGHRDPVSSCEDTPGSSRSGGGRQGDQAAPALPKVYLLRSSEYVLE
jgi:hypothetical protein